MGQYRSYQGEEEMGETHPTLQGGQEGSPAVMKSGLDTQNAPSIDGRAGEGPALTRKPGLKSGAPARQFVQNHIVNPYTDQRDSLMHNLALQPTYDHEDEFFEADRQTLPTPPTQLAKGQMQTLDRFCVNDTNRVARHAVTRILDGTSAPVTYVYGTTGLGKTHLVNAVALEWLRRNPSGRLIYLHYDMLVADVSEACLTNGIKELKEHLQDTDILILDDVHLLRGRKRTQEEVRCLIGRLAQAGKTVLVAGSLPPPQLAETGICSKLADVLVGGMVAEIKAPDYELRLRIANQLASEFYSRAGVIVPQRQIDLIARRCDASVRELVGAMTRLDAEIGSASGEISDGALIEILETMTASRAPKATLEAIFDYSSEKFGVTKAELRGPSRKRPFVRARQAFCMAARTLTDEPFKAIGGMISRDHSTAMHAIVQAEVNAESDSQFADRLSEIIERFTPS